MSAKYPIALGVLMATMACSAGAFDLLGTLKGVVTQNAENTAKEAAVQGASTMVKGGATESTEKTVEETPASKPLAVTAINPEDLVSNSNTVVVPTAYVKLLVEGEAFVRQTGHYQVGQNANTVKAGAKYKVVGIDKSLAQEIAQRAYDDFVAKLRAAGYTVLTYADIRDRDFVKSAEREKVDATMGLPVEAARGSDETYVVAAPSDEQQFVTGMNGGEFNQFIHWGKPLFTDATIIIPQYTIAAPQVWGEASGSYSTISAAIKTDPGMQLRSGMAHWMGAPVVRIMHGIPGVTTEAQVKVADRVGELAQTADNTSSSANALSKGLSMLTGFGSIQQSSSEYTFTIDRNTYMAGALKGAGEFNAKVAEVAVAAKK